MFDQVMPRNPPRCRVVEAFLDLKEAGIKSFIIAGTHDSPATTREGSSPHGVLKEAGLATFFEDTTQFGHETIDIDGKKDMQTKVMVTMFTLFAEIERDLISERMKQGLAAARAKGRLLGRPKGSLGKSKLDGKEQIIQDELKYGVAKAAIARKLGVSRTTMVNFIKTREL